MGGPTQEPQRDVRRRATAPLETAKGRDFQRQPPSLEPSPRPSLTRLFLTSKAPAWRGSIRERNWERSCDGTSWQTDMSAGKADDGGDQPMNDFERSVGAVLKENGYEIVPQVGVAGFFVDLGVKHPAKEGTFLLGIECDGASYHSGRSARESRPSPAGNPENLGWKITGSGPPTGSGAEMARLRRCSSISRVSWRMILPTSWRSRRPDRLEVLRQRLVALR